MGFNNMTGNSDTSSQPPIGGTPSNNGLSAFPGMGGNYDPMDYLIDYNAKFKNATPVLFRDEVIYKTIAILIGKNKPNPLLVGPAGVGKTAIVEDIARRLANNDITIPDKLKNHKIYELPLSSIVAGSGIVGQLEEKLQTVIDFINDPKNKAILFIDEVHQLADSHSTTYEKIAQLLKPALARGEMHCIGATTTQEVKNLMNDPAFNRRFSRRIVNELSRDETITILESLKTSFFTHYQNKVVLDTTVFETTVTLADAYTTAGSHRPDNAITLLDRACAEAVINRKKAELASANNPTILAALQASPIIKLTDKQLKATAISLMTGDAKQDDLDCNMLTEQFKSIKGQDKILKDITDALIRFDLKLFPQNKPVTFLFAGTSGVGKTEVAKIIANVLTSVKPITLNMTEYSDNMSITRIIGSPDGYVGSDSHRELPFDILESNPYQVILLDEFEKGHNSIQRLFMSAFEEGYIKTSKGNIIDFSKSIIIATTNAGHKEMTSNLGFGTQTANSELTKETIIKDLSAWFDTELLNRFDYIYTFNELNESIYKDILISKYHKELDRLRQERRRVTLPDDIPDDELADMIKNTYVPAFGARPAGKTIKKYIEDKAIEQAQINMLAATPTISAPESIIETPDVSTDTPIDSNDSNTTTE